MAVALVGLYLAVQELMEHLVEVGVEIVPEEMEILLQHLHLKEIVAAVAAPTM
jgi:hypothetical protein